MRGTTFRRFIQSRVLDNFFRRVRAPSAVALKTAHFGRANASGNLALGGLILGCTSQIALALAEPSEKLPDFGRRIEEDYELGGELGYGSFAVVRKGRCKRTGKAVAIKVVPKSRQSEEEIRNECSMLQRVSLHKCIASLEGLYETEECFYIVMEFVSGGGAS